MTHGFRRTKVFLFVLIYIHSYFVVNSALQVSTRDSQESIADALESFRLTNFVSLLRKSQLLDLFQGIGDQFTVLAPTNGALPKPCRGLLETNITSLENLLLYQVIDSGGFTIGNLVSNIQPATSANFTTLEGSRLPIHLLNNGMV
jgi:uncharacterized surface protein with fasciclin (FAS1) repeats